MLDKKQILSLKVSLGSYSSFVSEIIRLSLQKTSSYVCIANVHMLIEAQNNPSFRILIDNANITCPDGMPIAKSFKYLHNHEQDRVDGMSLLPTLLAEASIKKLSVFFYGGSEFMLERTQELVLKNYPYLSIAGMISPPFRDLNEVETEDIINQINASNANLVFVVLGCPKQETWMASMFGKIHACMIGIGGALPVFVGIQKRAPQWMQKNSLEWLHRLSQEPKRLFKRYLFTNSQFVFILIKKVIFNKIKSNGFIK
ncbi:WecB/TagA/CpsF family glycosyltransferase [Pedobacter sp. Leaf250]|uniref:WecB/TagA/CpsF family glycosyltransferase n=1 Tax=Pedobacter sp. Leaf250 TaxID=2876559 RepID=UPI001E5DAC6E|nr:WecB/TagA/CpsF family glycosyltransferase [Pedobacter sp. Leaf250]